VRWRGEERALHIRAGNATFSQDPKIPYREHSRHPSMMAHSADRKDCKDSFNVVASPFPIITERGAEPNGKIYAKAVQEVLLERAHLQAGGLPTTAGPNTGGRPSPAVCPRSVSKSLAGCKRKGLEEAKPTAVQLPANKRVRGPSGDSVPAPAAHPGPATSQSCKQRGKKVLWYLPW